MKGRIKVKDRWETNKLGLVNFWYYDDEEFELSDGKLLLRGANGSGKSVTMQSFIPLLLDGNKRPERIDPFGTSARRIENYLLMSDDDIDRTAYLYMEFKKKITERYLTIGMGLKAVKGKSVEAWYFIIADGRRIKKDLYLYKENGNEKIPLTKRELQNRIGEGNFYTESQMEYKRKVNEYLFGYNDIEHYDELMDLLINIRSPKLSKDFKPTTIYGILENSLRQLTEDDLRSMSEAMENMDNIKLRIEQLDKCLRALKYLEEPFTKYNNYILYEKAKKYLEKYNDVINLEKEKNSLLSILESETLEREKIEKDILILENELDVALKKIDEFSKSDIKDARDKLEVVNRDLNQALLENQNKLKEQDLKKETLRKRQVQSKEIMQEIEEVEEKIEKVLSDMEDYAQECAFKNHDIFKGDFNILFAKEAINKHREKIKRAKEALDKYEFKKKEFEDILQKKDRAQADVEYKKSRLSEAEEYLTTIKEEYIEEVVKWNKNNREIVLNDLEIQSISKSIMKIDDYSDLLDTKNVVVDKYNQNKGIMSAKIEQANLKIEDLNQQIKQIEGKIEEIKNLKEIEFIRDNEVIKNRQRLKEMNIPFVPLYRAIDFKDGLSEDIKVKIESALFDMGILDALIIPKKYKDEVLSKDEGGCDKYLFAEPSFLSYNLTQYLKVDSSELNGVAYEDVDNVLQSILIDKNSLTYVDEKGNYGIGILNGKAKKDYDLKYIGESSRKKFRERQIEELVQQKKCIEKDISEQMKLIGEYKNRMVVLEEKFYLYPDTEDIKEAIEIISRQNLELMSAENELILITKKYEEINGEIIELKKQVYELTDGFEIEKNYKAFCDAEDAATDYVYSLNEFESLSNKKSSKLEILKATEENIEELNYDINIILGDINRKNEFIKERENSKRVYEELLQRLGYEDLKEELDRCYKIKQENPIEIRKLRDESVKLSERIKNMQDKIQDKEKEFVIQSNILKVLEEIFLEEYNLGYVSDFTIEKKISELCRDIINNKQGTINKSKEEYDNALYESYTKYSGILRDYYPKVVTILKRDNINEEFKELYLSAERKDIRFRIDGKEVDFKFLKDRLNGDLEINKLLLTDEEKKFFQDILLKTISSKVTAKIHHSRNWVNKMNEIMQSMNTSSSFKLTLKWIPKRAENEMQLDTKRIIEILEKEVVDSRDIEGLSKHFSSRVKEILRNSDDLGERKNYHTVIKEILDYRKWYEFKLYSSKEGERDKELTNNAFYQLSGGEKAMAMYIPLFTAVYSRYDMAKKDCPRIVALDEAFAGVDDENIRDMFRILNEMELDYILNSQVLWGTYDTVESLAIANIERPDNSDVVCISRYLWNGRQLNYL